MKQIKFYEVYDLRAIINFESATCYESMIDTQEQAEKAAEGYGGGVIYECTAEVDETTTPHTVIEIYAKEVGLVLTKRNQCLASALP